MEQRMNQEFTIFDSIHVGNIEYVLAERPTHLDRYVVWECLNGTEYRLGDYTSSFSKAQEILHERAHGEAARQRAAGTLPPASIEVLDFEKRDALGERLVLRPILPDEQMYAFGQSTQLAGQCGSHGRLRGDFDTTGGMFYTSWDSHRSYLVTDEFKSELDQVVNALRQKDEFGNILKNRSAMEAYCHSNPDGRFPLNLGDGYGFRADTKERTYLLRCKPAVGEYDFYLYVYKSEFLNSHVQQAAHGIRFIDSRYNELFRLKDGEKILILTSDGDNLLQVCRYIDQTHVEVGRNLYHICEFAERMEKNGNIYAPANPSETSAEKGSSSPKKKPRKQQER